MSPITRRIPEAYNNTTVHSRLNEYNSMATEVHGPEFDSSTEPIDGEIVMRVGGGKKHDRFWIGDNIIDTARTPTFVQIRGRSTSSSPAIRPRPNTTKIQMAALKVTYVSVVVPSLLNMFVLYSNHAIKYCRPKCKKSFKHSSKHSRRRRRRGGRPSGRGCNESFSRRPNARSSIRLFSTCRLWARRWIFHHRHSLRLLFLIVQLLLLLRVT